MVLRAQVDLVSAFFEGLSSPVNFGLETSGTFLHVVSAEAGN